MDPDPGYFHLPQRPQQIGEPGAAVEVEPVVRGDLADQDQLLHPLGGQLLGLGDDRFDGP